MKMKHNLAFSLLDDRIDFMENNNELAPFPIYDTGYIKYCKRKLKEMSKKEYNELPVAFCKYCKSLHIITDELENDICMGCGSINEVIVDSIDNYLDLTKDQVEDEE